MFGLRQRLEAWRGRASQPRDPNQTRAQAKPPDAALSGLEPASAVKAGTVAAGVGVSETPGAPPASAHPTAMRQAEALMRRLEWTVIRRLDGQLQGDYRTLFRGAGLMLADLR